MKGELGRKSCNSAREPSSRNHASRCGSATLHAGIPTAAIRSRYTIRRRKRLRPRPKNSRDKRESCPLYVVHRLKSMHLCSKTLMLTTAYRNTKHAFTWSAFSELQFYFYFSHNQEQRIDPAMTTPAAFVGGVGCAAKGRLSGVHSGGKSPAGKPNKVLVCAGCATADSADSVARLTTGPSRQSNACC